MKRTPSFKRLSRAFTLVEIMIVAALIALLSGIAVFSIQEFYNSNIKKATLGDLRQLVTALEFAHQDLQFYPKFSRLNDPKLLVLFDENTGQSTPGSVVSHIDYYGYIPGGQPPLLSRIQTKWGGPYFGMSNNRARSARGGRSGITLVRLADVYYDPQVTDKSASLVDWPADNWGTPYVLYQLKGVVDTAGIIHPVFIGSQSEEGDLFTAVVSYGPNKIPGGSLGTADPYRAQVVAGSMVREGDIVGGGAATYTIKGVSANIPDPQLRLETNYPPTNTSAALYTDFENSLRAPRTGNPRYDPNAGIAGLQDVGSDDIIIDF